MGMLQAHWKTQGMGNPAENILSAQHLNILLKGLTSTLYEHSQYINDNLLPNVPVQGVNILNILRYLMYLCKNSTNRKVPCYLKSLRQESIHQRYLVSLGCCGRSQWIKDSFLPETSAQNLSASKIPDCLKNLHKESIHLYYFTTISTCTDS